MGDRAKSEWTPSFLRLWKCPSFPQVASPAMSELSSCSDLLTHTSAPRSYGLRNTNLFKYQNKRKIELVVQVSTTENVQIITYLELTVLLFYHQDKDPEITPQNLGVREAGQQPVALEG